MKLRERIAVGIARLLGVEESLWTIDDVGSPRDEDAGWVPLYGVAGRHQVPDWKREQAVRWSRVLAASHLAGRLIGIYQDFVVGDQVTVRARPADKTDARKAELVNEQLETWEEASGVDHQVYELLHEMLLVDGEVLILLTPGDALGPEIDLIDPLTVESYVVGRLRSIAEIRVPREVVYPGETGDPVTLPVVRDPAAVRYSEHPDGVVVRACLRPGTHPRGVGVLFNLVDKLRLDDRFLEADLKRAIAAGMVWADVTVKGGRKQVEEARRQFSRMPGFGAVRVHGENVEIKLQRPNLGMFEAKAGHLMSHRIIAAAAGIPLTWLGTGEDANRASAAEMGSPTYKHLQRRQNVFRSLLRRLYLTVITMRRQAGLITVPPEAITLDVQLPELSARDLSLLSLNLQRVQLALDAAVDRGWITARTAQAIMLEQLQQITDVELDPDEEGTPPEQSAGPRDAGERLQQLARRSAQAAEEALGAA